MAGHKDAAAQTLYYSYVQEAATHVAGLQTGQYDLIYGLTSDNYDIIAKYPWSGDANSGSRYFGSGNE